MKATVGNIYRSTGLYIIPVIEVPLKVPLTVGLEDIQHGGTERTVIIRKKLPVFPPSREQLIELRQKSN